MTDFTPILKRTIDGLADRGPAVREKVYDKARLTIRAKLESTVPALGADQVARQMKALEDAIDTVEFDYKINDAVSFGSPKPAQPARAPEPVAAERPAPRLSPFAPAPKPAPSAPAFPSPRAQPEPRPEFRPAAPVRSEPAVRAAAPSYAPPPPPEFPADGAFATMDPEDDIAVRLAKPRSRTPLALLLTGAVLMVAAGGAAAWYYRADLARMAGLDTPAKPAAARKADPAKAPAEKAAAPKEQGPVKFTQRLNADGSETDEGPAAGTGGVGEGTTTAAATAGNADAAAPEGAAPPAAEALPGAADPAAPAQGDPATETAQGTTVPVPAVAENPAAPAAAGTAVAVAQKAIFYEERTSADQGSANTGNVVWSVVQDSPGGDLAAEPAIRAEASIPDRDLKLRMTIRRNGDPTLPASHLIELVVDGPEGKTATIDKVLRITLKPNESDAGNPLLGVPAKISDGFFLIALTDTQAEIDANMALLRRERWIDIPIVYATGRRALITLEKGIPGDKTFDEVLKVWEAKASG